MAGNVIDGAFKTFKINGISFNVDPESKVQLRRGGSIVTESVQFSNTPFQKLTTEVFSDNLTVSVFFTEDDYEIFHKFQTNLGALHTIFAETPSGVQYGGDNFAIVMDEPIMFSTDAQEITFAGTLQRYN